MSRHETPPPRDPEGKRSRGGSPTREERAGSASPRSGRSGYGMESIRPHLRAQLEQQKLLRPTFPPEDAESRDISNRSNRSDL